MSKVMQLGFTLSSPDERLPRCAFRWSAFLVGPQAPGAFFIQFWRRRQLNTWQPWGVETVLTERLLGIVLLQSQEIPVQ